MTASVPRTNAHRAWLAIAVCWLVWGALYATKLHAVKPGQTLAQILHYAFSDAVLWALFTPGVLWIAKRLPVQPPHVALRLGLHLVIGTAVTLLHMYVDAVQNSLINFGPGGTLSVNEFLGYAFPSRLHPNLMVYGAIVAIGHVLERQRHLIDSRQRVATLRAHLAEARLQALRLQLQPHFLFNCLNTVAGLVETRPREARRMLSQVSDLLRLALETHVEEEITLRDELQFVRTYLALEQARFQERLRVSEDIDPDCMDARVPAFLLQPLVENAVRHGLAPVKAGGTVCIEARRAGSQLMLAVRDDGIGIARPTKLGIGLSSVEQRLAELFGTEHQFAVGPAPGGGTVVTLSLPLRKETTPAPQGVEAKPAPQGAEAKEVRA